MGSALNSRLYKRRRIIRAGWLLACIIERIGAFFKFFFGDLFRTSISLIIAAALAFVVHTGMMNIKAQSAASPEEIRAYLTRNDHRTNFCMVELLPRRMGTQPATLGMLGRAEEDCQKAVSDADVKNNQLAIIKSLGAKK